MIGKAEKQGPNTIFVQYDYEKNLLEFNEVEGSLVPKNTNGTCTINEINYFVTKKPF